MEEININNDINETIAKSDEETYIVVGVRFKDFGKVYYFDPCGIELEKGDGAIVETIRGLEFAYVTSMMTELPASRLSLPLKPVIRRATEEDKRAVEENKKFEKGYMEVCRREIAELKLDMELVGCDIGFDKSRVTFYFTADGRVDFRELVKKLVAALHMRIELRQVGTRDTAKLVGGVGPCGRVVCCAAHLSGFEHVTMKMAKDQGLALNPTKISGICGKLMCCLKYEEETYEHMRNRMPSVGSEVNTPDGPGTIFENMLLTERCRVKITLPDGTPDLREYQLNDLVVTRYNRQKNSGASKKSDDIPEE